MGHRLRRALFANQGAAGVSRSGSLGWVGLDRRALGALGDEADIDRHSQAGRTEATGTPNSEERHGGEQRSGEWNEVVRSWRDVCSRSIARVAGHDTPERGLARLVYPTTRFPAKGSLPPASSFVPGSLALQHTVSHSC